MMENKRTHRKQDDKYFDKLAKCKKISKETKKDVYEESNGIVEIDGIDYIPISLLDKKLERLKEGVVYCTSYEFKIIDRLFNEIFGDKPSRESNNKSEEKK